MFSHPLQKLRVIHTSICNRKANMYKLLICAVDTDTIHFKK